MGVNLLMKGKDENRQLDNFISNIKTLEVREALLIQLVREASRHSADIKDKRISDF